MDRMASRLIQSHSALISKLRRQIKDLRSTSGDYVEKAGDSMSGLLTLNAGADVPTGDVTVATGDVETESSSNGLILRAPDGTRYRVTVSNLGNLQTAAV